MPNNRIAALKARLNLSPAELAHYLGVARPTADKWLAGQRRPPAIAMRLLDVLALVEMALPDVHDSLMKRTK
jgi:DNA-binding transcriptional regulator YiaG